MSDRRRERGGGGQAVGQERERERGGGGGGRDSQIDRQTDRLTDIMGYLTAVHNAVYLTPKNNDQQHPLEEIYGRSIVGVTT